MYAADGHIYMHVPGDKVGSMTVSGLAFSGLCQGDSQSGSNSYNFNEQMTGFERVLRWYRANCERQIESAALGRLKIQRWVEVIISL